MHISGELLPVTLEEGATGISGSFTRGHWCNLCLVIMAHLILLQFSGGVIMKVML